MENKKILIVDDNNLNRKVFENIIAHSYLFDTAENGQEAIRKIKENSFDIILMDIQMPIMDGISTLKIIKEENLTQSPIIAISAFSNQNDREYFLAAGFDEFIPKPVKPKILLECLYFHLNKRQPPTPTEALPDSEDIIDHNIFNQIKKYNTDEDIKTVYEDFLDESQNLIKDIKKLIEEENYSEIGEKLHILKGNSGTLGAKQVFKHAGHFEQKIRDLKFEDILEDYLTLQNQLSIFKHQLDRLNNQLNE